jgi:MFS family permease
VLRERSFARYLAAVTISQLGTGMATVALAFAVLEFGGATDLGIVLLAREIPIVVFLLLGGVFADRVSRRNILVGCDLVKGLSQAMTAALFFTGTAEVWSVAVLQGLFGVAIAFSRPASLGIVREATSDARLQEANAFLQLSRSSLAVAGPAVGAVIVHAASPAWALAADAVTFLVSALLIASMRLAPAVRLAQTTVLRDLRDGWGEFRSRSWVVAMVVSFGLYQLAFFPAFYVLGPLVAKEELGGASAWGTVLALQAVGAIVGGVLALRVAVSRPLVAALVFVVPAGALLATLSVPLALAVIASTAFAVGAGQSISETLWATALQRNVPEHALSRISSFDWFGSVALNPIGYVIVGPLAGAIGVAETLAVAAALNLAATLGVLLVPSVRNLRS